MPDRTPVFVVTGLLGAGKTTLIKRLLTNQSGRRIAVLVNEFGEVGFDGALIAGSGESEVVELTNGCICCRVSDDLVPTLDMLLGRPTPPDAILLETSGLALPQPVVRAFRRPEIAGRATVGGVVVVVDAQTVAEGRFDDSLAELRANAAVEAAGRPHVEDDDPVAELFEDQVRAADLVVLAKIDEVTSAARDALVERVRAAMPPAARVVPAAHGELDPALVLGLEAEAEAHVDRRPSHHDLLGIEHEHDDFDSFVVETAPVEDRFAYEDRVLATMAAHGLLRVKGVLAVRGKGSRFLLQGVPGRVTTALDTGAEATRTDRTRLVVIGPKGMRAADIRSGLGAA